MKLADVDWPSWEPDQRATLVFVITDGSVLLIRKKRGLGAGKINGPGGRIDPGETPEQCAVRELSEEVGVTPLGLRYAGEHAYQFTDGLKLHVAVFSATGYQGRIVETEEAVPLWFRLEEIPYDEMWSDDRYWIPLMLEGRPFSGRWIFDGDDFLDYELTS